jgi:F-type H+-transporting ATPase subunit a
MQSNFLAKLLTIILLIFSTTVNAQHEVHEGAPKEVSLKTKIKESINHHLLDSHDFTFFSDSETGKHYGFSLPVIFFKI